MSKTKYHLINPDKNLTKEDFSQVLSILEEAQGVGITPEKTDETATIFYEFDICKPQLKLVNEPTNLKHEQKALPNGRIIVETESNDMITEYLIKTHLHKYNFRLYSEELETLLPQDLRITTCKNSTDGMHIKSFAAIRSYDLEPLFFLNSAYIYYAQSKKDGSIHITNDNLVYHLTQSTTLNLPRSAEFSYKVSDSIQEFVRKFDSALIPENFYQYFGKSQKIINYSGFDIEENPGRKVFIKPLIFEYESDKMDFFMIAQKDSALLFMDKIRQGENLNDSILRLLREEVKIANDYLGAVVERKVEFDLDSQDNITPRLIVRIFVKQANLTNEQRSKANRTWISLDQIKGL